MNTRILLTFASMAMLAAPTIHSEVTVVDNNKFKFSASGRILFDGALFGPRGNTFSDGVALPDARLGGKASFGKFTAKLDIGYGMQKLSFKDVYIQYTLNENNLIRLGYFVHQFGLNAATSSSMKPTFLSQTSDDFFNATGRNLGVMYVYDKGPWFAGVSAYASSKSLTEYANTQGKISVGGSGRFVWRPFHNTGEVVQIGVSPRYQGANHTRLESGETSPGSFGFSANFPTKVDKVSLLKADIPDSKGVFMVTPELLLSKDRFALESQYYYMNVNRRDGLKNYTAQGVYGMGRVLILGDKEYKYSHADAGLATPGKNTLEAVIGYNYTNANCDKAGILGGISNDYSLTLNYYINKYVICRLRYSYTNVWGSPTGLDTHVNIIQARVMFKF